MSWDLTFTQLFHSGKFGVYFGVGSPTRPFATFTPEVAGVSINDCISIADQRTWVITLDATDQPIKREELAWADFGKGYTIGSPVFFHWPDGLTTYWCFCDTGRPNGTWRVEVADIWHFTNVGQQRIFNTQVDDVICCLKGGILMPDATFRTGLIADEACELITTAGPVMMEATAPNTSILLARPVAL